MSNGTLFCDYELLLLATAVSFAWAFRLTGMCFVQRGRKGYSPNWEERSEGRGEKSHGKPGALGSETQSA